MYVTLIHRLKAIIYNTLSPQHNTVTIDIYGITNQEIKSPGVTEWSNIEYAIQDPRKRKLEC